MQWFDPKLHVTYVHPSEVREGMRLARKVHKPIGPGGAMRPCTELTPVWAIGLGPSSCLAYGPSYLFRLMTGELRTAQSNDRVPIDPDIIPENRPPHEGEWITNEPFGFHDDKPSVIPDRHWHDRSTVMEEWSANDGRLYWLLNVDNGRYWVCRREGAKRWNGPSRRTLDLAGAQLEAIMEGRGW